MKTLLTKALIGILSCGLLAGCSNSPTSSEAPSKAPPKASAVPSVTALKLHHVWLVAYGNGGTRMIEVENIGPKPIKAFKGTWAILDDFGAEKSKEEMEYTSQTTYYSSPQGASTSHAIASGEHVCICYTMIDNQPPDKISAVDKKDLLIMLPDGSTQKDIDDNLLVNKIALNIEKIVNVE